MTRASVVLLFGSAPALATVEINGVEVEVVDAHLHALESPGDFNLVGKASIIEQIPSFVVPYYSALATQTGDAWVENLGISDQLVWAGVDHAVLLASYTQHTVGFATNRHVESVINDERNRPGEGGPIFYGMASINLDDFTDADVAASRLSALETYLEQHRFIGIKLAHAHQGVAFDDPLYDGIYEVAARTGVAVLLHTGISPFPGTQSTEEFTNPAGLASVINRFNGLEDSQRVDFILAHVGTADAQATLDALELAAINANVWLEVSALGQDMIFNRDGSQSETSGPQHPWIMKDILEMGLVEQTMFATDGPQSSGKIRSYLEDIIESMQAAGYTTEEMARVLSGSFYDCFPTAQK